MIDYKATSSPNAAEAADSTPAALDKQLEIVQSAQQEILADFPDDPNATSVIQRYVQKIKESLLKREPIDPEIVAGNDNLLPLQKVVTSLNADRGFTKNDIANHVNGIRQAELLRETCTSVIQDVTRYWGGWRGLPENLHSIFTDIHNGINEGNLPDLNAERIKTLGLSLPAQLRSDIENIYADHGRLLTIPEITPQQMKPSEQVKRYLPLLKENGFELDSDSTQKIGNGSEGTVYLIEDDNQTRFALKVKHGQDVSNSSESLTVAAALSSLNPPYSVSSVAVLFENRSICLMEYLPNAPDLQALASFAMNNTIPDNQKTAETVASFIHQYRTENPQDSDLKELTQQLSDALYHMSSAQAALAESPSWSAFFKSIDNPLTTNPANFLVRDMNDKKLSLTCIDAR